MNWLVGHTGFSALDYWTAAHSCFWFVVGSTLAALRLPRVKSVLACLSIALTWEIFERFAEKVWPMVWLSPESWWNAWLSDPLTVLLGCTLAFLGYDRWRT